MYASNRSLLGLLHSPQLISGMGRGSFIKQREVYGFGFRAIALIAALLRKGQLKISYSNWSKLYRRILQQYWI